MSNSSTKVVIMLETWEQLNKKHVLMYVKLFYRFYQKKKKKNVCQIVAAMKNIELQLW